MIRRHPRSKRTISVAPHIRSIHLSRCKWDLQDVKWRVYLYDSAEEYFMRENFHVDSHIARLSAPFVSSSLSLSLFPSHLSLSLPFSLSPSRSFRKIKQLAVACSITFFARESASKKNVCSREKTGLKGCARMAGCHREGSSAASLTSTRFSSGASRP